MGVSQKAFNWHQRKRANIMSMKDRMEEQANIDKTPPTRDIVTCPNCGFTARYKFVRCPNCDEERK